ncbi:hypothetical protein BpHYR1_035681 [Brachionus plicatilis]|uniref:Uncharacterized protein n=1 Tax=Brachionus plicatilis TaxID=10195 RepID=A0A3M7QLH5_BRAPC|nr:hypothetical protein BpHYR1_035681 [Brachionus plicatilis]
MIGQSSWTYDDGLGEFLVIVLELWMVEAVILSFVMIARQNANGLESFSQAHVIAQNTIQLTPICWYGLSLTPMRTSTGSLYAFSLRLSMSWSKKSCCSHFILRMLAFVLVICSSELKSVPLEVERG